MGHTKRLTRLVLLEESEASTSEHAAGPSEFAKLIIHPFPLDHNYEKGLSKGSTMAIVLSPLGVVIVVLVLVVFICWIRARHMHRHRMDTDRQIYQTTRIIDDVREIEMFEISSYNVNESYDENDCSICLGGFTNNDSIYKLPCNHFYHISCINEWFRNRIVCPLCRQDYTNLV